MRRHMIMEHQNNNSKELTAELFAAATAAAQARARTEAPPLTPARAATSSSISANKRARNDHSTKFKCSLCDKVYAWRSDAFKHLRTVHLIAQPLSTQVIDVPVRVEREKERYFIPLG